MQVQAMDFATLERYLGHQATVIKEFRRLQWEKMTLDREMGECLLHALSSLHTHTHTHTQALSLLPCPQGEMGECQHTTQTSGVT